jgi:SAM-dependent methyltransferase
MPSDVDAASGAGLPSGGGQAARKPEPFPEKATRRHTGPPPGAASGVAPGDPPGAATGAAAAGPAGAPRREASSIGRDLDEALFIDGVRALAAGKITSTMLDLALEMQLFPKIHGKRVSVAELAQLLSLPLWSARIMAQFLCREGLLVYRDKLLSSAPGIGPFLLEEDPDRRELRVILDFNLSKADLKQVLLNPPKENGYERLTKEQHFIEVNIRRIIWGEQLAQLYSFKGHRLLLDVAGASGGLVIGIRRHNPHLRAILFDLPDTEEFARRCIAEAEDGEFIRFVGGDFLSGSLPRGADVALLSNIIHNWTPEQDKMILSKIYDALEPGGTLLVKESFLKDDWSGPMEAVFHAFFMGRDTWKATYGEVEEMMAEVGFVDLERRFDISGVVIGRKDA